MRPPILISILLLAVFFSCTIEKRMHRPGYHIEWKKRFGKAQAQERKKTFSPTAETEQPAILTETIRDTTHALAAIGDTLFPVISAAIPKTEPAASEKPVEKPGFSHSLPESKQESPTDNVRKKHMDLDGVFTLIIAVLAVYAALMLTCLIVGVLIVDTAPVWGIILLFIGGCMLLTPIIGIIASNISRRKEVRLQPDPTDPPPRKAFAGRNIPRQFSPLGLKGFLRGFPSSRQMRNAFIGIGILVLLYLAAMVLAIVYGILLLGTEPVWGPVLLITGIAMLVWPFIVFFIIWVADGIQIRREARRKKREEQSGASFSDEMPLWMRNFGMRSFSEKFQPRRLQESLIHARSEIPGAVAFILNILVILGAIALVVLSIVFGISLILSGNLVWGSILLAIGSCCVLGVGFLAIRRAVRRKRNQEYEEAIETPAFAPRQRKTAQRSPGFDTLELQITIILLLGLAILATCIIFGISFVAMGAWFRGVLLLLVAAIMIAVPIVMLIAQAIRRRRRRRELKRRMDEGA